MARLIANTPKLDKKASAKFLQELSENTQKSYPIDTPNIDETIEEIMFYVRRKKKQAENNSGK